MESEPLLPGIQPLIGLVDHRNRPANKFTTGRWTASLFIIGVEIAERFALCGIGSNLITYLIVQLQESTAGAAATVNTWVGVTSMTPLLGAVVADSCLGRYWTILIASLLYILGLGMLTLSSLMPTPRPTECNKTLDSTSWPPTRFQRGFFFFSIYLVSLAQGGHKPSVQAFAADQFDQNDPVESVWRSAFFNWWFFSLCGSELIATLILTYVEDNISWGLGFGIPCIAMGVALAVFLFGRKTYRYSIMEDKSSFTGIWSTFRSMMRSWRVPSNASEAAAGEMQGLLTADKTKLDKKVPSERQEEKAEGILGLFPIWATCSIYAISLAQSATFFTKQASTMDRRISSTVQVPPATLQSIINITIVIFLPIYDQIVVPIARRVSKLPSGFTMLQRIGIGMVIAMISLAVAALVELKRLKTAREYGLVDDPNATIPMSVWWLVPQYVLSGISDVFLLVGEQEFFYDQMPDNLRSLGLALFLSIFGIGNFISSFLVSVIDSVSRRGGESWFPNNLNRAHLDYFYWLLFGLSGAALVVYLFIASSYVYKVKARSGI